MERQESEAAGVRRTNPDSRLELREAGERKAGEAWPASPRPALGGFCMSCGHAISVRTLFPSVDTPVTGVLY